MQIAQSTDAGCHLLSTQRSSARLKRRVFIRVTSLGHGFGARIDGIALHEIGDRVLSDVLSLLEEWGLLIFPRQALDDPDLHAFATRIGRLEESSRKVCLSPQFPTIGNLSNLRDNDGERIGFASTTTDFWHSDQQHRENPAARLPVLSGPVGHGRGNKFRVHRRRQNGARL